MLWPLFSFPLLLGDDFNQTGTTVTVPANRKTFQIPQFFTVVDDDIDEDEQSFVLVAEIGEDVPDKFAIIAETGYEVSKNVSCFQLGVGRTECFGRRGATQIRIDDDDRKFSHLLIAIKFQLVVLLI